MAQLTKKLGFWSIVLLTINTIIGSGIFLTPGTVVVQSGQWAPTVYAVAAFFAGILAITFAGAAKYITKSGAAYAYAKAAFGKNVGFYVGITRFVSASIAWGVMAVGVVKSILSILGKDSENFIAITLGFLCLMLVLLIINLLGPQFFTFINNLSTIGKLFALVTPIVVGIGLLAMSEKFHFAQIHSLTGKDGQPLVSQMTFSIFVMAVISAFYAFTGFESVATGSQDMESPEKNLPKAIPTGIGIIFLVYIGIIGISLLLNPQALVESKQVIVLAEVFAHPFIKNIILYGALVSMFGINVAASFHTPRILEAIAQEKQLSAWFDKRTAGNFPLRAFVLTIGIAILVPMSFSYEMGSIMIISAMSRFVQFLVVPACLVVFYFELQKEQTLPHVQKNSFTDLFIPILAFFATLLLLVKFNWTSQFTMMTSHGRTQLNVYAIITMLLGFVLLPLGLFIHKRKTNPS